VNNFCYNERTLGHTKYDYDPALQTIPRTLQAGTVIVYELCSLLSIYGKR